MNSLRYIDLFCGAGGLGEGFYQSGFNASYHIDSDPWSIQTVRLREIFHHLQNKGKSSTYYNFLRNCEKLYTADKLFEKLQDDKIKSSIEDKAVNVAISKDNIKDIIKSISRKIDNSNNSVIIGGPPCQAYSLAKRNRMRKPMEGLKTRALKKAKDENIERIEEYLNDERHGLYELYLQIIKEIKPAAFVYENVPGILTASSGDIDNQNIIMDLLLKDLSKKAGDYVIIPVEENELVLNFNKIDFKDCIVNSSKFGVPQNRKRFILVGIRSSLNKNSDFIKTVFYKSLSKYKHKNTLTIKDAIKDLPYLQHNSGSDTYNKRKLKKNKSTYAENLMSSSLNGVLNHRSRKHMDSDLERYSFYTEFARKNKRNATLHDLIKSRKDLLPDHKSAKILLEKNNKISKYVDRFKVQQWNAPSTTITAHISKDGHAFIHPDSKQNRSLTVREAARIQSFPDDYAFCGPRTEQFKQVGNAVPVLLSKAIATAIRNVIEQCDG